MSKKNLIAIKNQAQSETLELHFLNEIQDSYDWFTGMTYSKVQEIIDKVNYYQPSKVLCIIDSIGGDAFAGLAIYNYLKNLNAKIEVEVIGLAGSIASVIAMAANKGKLRIAKNAFIMIHKAEGVVVGSVEQITQGAAVIQKMDDQIADVYAQRTGKPVDQIKALYEKGDYWMTGEEAVAQGFADSVINQAINLQVAARLDIEDYSNIPEAIRAQLSDPESDKNFIQTQFQDMKKFFTEIVNAIKGVKPAEGQAITNQIAEAIQTPFEKLGDEIDNQITNKVDESLKGDVVNKAIETQVSNAVAAIDFSKDGPAKTAIENATKLAVDAATKEMNDKIVAMDKTKGEIEKIKADLEAELTAQKGKATNSGKQEEGAKVIGTFKKG